MATAELVDREYNAITSGFATQYRNVDPFLLIKSAMLRKKYASEHKQHFWLELQYKEGVDVVEKSSRIYGIIGRFPSHHGYGHFLLDMQSNLETLLAIASDEDIVRITGDVVPL